MKKRFPRKIEKLRKTFFLLGLVFALSATYLVLTIKMAPQLNVPVTETTTENNDLIVQVTFRKMELPNAVEKVEVKKVNRILAQSFSNYFLKVDNGADVNDDPGDFAIEDIPSVDEYVELKVDWVILDRKPIYKGCEKLKSEEEREACFQRKLSNYIIDNFELTPMGWGDTQKIYVNFVIDKEGNVEEVKAVFGDEKDRKQLENLIGDLPQFLPGMYKGKYVRTSFTLPVVLRN